MMMALNCLMQVYGQNPLPTQSFNFVEGDIYPFVSTTSDTTVKIATEFGQNANVVSAPLDIFPDPLDKVEGDLTILI
jgi:hypothetical protein